MYLIRSRDGRRALGVAAIATAVMALAVTAFAQPQDGRLHEGRPAALSAATATATTATPSPTPTAWRRSVPVRLDIPKIAVHTPLTKLGLNKNGTVEVPPITRVREAGWYRYGATPGENGPAVILGHVDSAKDGRGIFYELHRMRSGDTIRVTRKDGTVAEFVVDSVQEIPKDRFPTQRVYGKTGRSELRLITCGGVFDRAKGKYQSNVIVFAHRR